MLLLMPEANHLPACVQNSALFSLKEKANVLTRPSRPYPAATSLYYLLPASSIPPLPGLDQVLPSGPLHLPFPRPGGFFPGMFVRLLHHHFQPSVPNVTAYQG